MIRELQGALAQVGEESWVTSSRTYQQSLQEIQRLNELLNGKVKEMEVLARERDEAQRYGHIKTQYYHVSVSKYVSFTCQVPSICVKSGNCRLSKLGSACTEAIV